MLAADLILPILDGLDEIPDETRGPAISRINDALRPSEPLVVTCRAEQYRDVIKPQSGPTATPAVRRHGHRRHRHDVIRPPSGLAATLRGAAAIQLRPLDPSDVTSYLRHDAATPGAAARWDPVLATLGTQAPVGEALITPLMAGLARARPSTTPGLVSSPAIWVTLPSCAAPHSPTGQRSKLSCSTRSFPPPTGRLPPAAGRCDKPNHGWYSLPVTSNAPSAAPT
jgi:hypothetical protein